MSKTAWIIVFILTASIAFPLFGYYLDFLHRKKMLNPKKKK